MLGARPRREGTSGLGGTPGVVCRPSAQSRHHLWAYRETGGGRERGESETKTRKRKRHLRVGSLTRSEDERQEVLGPRPRVCVGSGPRGDGDGEPGATGEGPGGWGWGASSAREPPREPSGVSRVVEVVGLRPRRAVLRGRAAASTV